LSIDSKTECILIIFVNLLSGDESLPKPNKVLNKLISAHSIIIGKTKFEKRKRGLTEKRIGKLSFEFKNTLNGKLPQT